MTHQFTAHQTASVADRQSVDRRPGVLETLELRWFAPGAVPAAGIRWFEGAAPQIVVEKRMDTYLLTQRPDLGVKRRNGGPLQVKERLGTGRRMSVGEHLTGRVEEWRKQALDRSPAAGDRWVEVTKTVLTYPYRAIVEGGLTSACDIELAAVKTEGVEAWTLAFEASGRPAVRMRTLSAAVEQFLSDTDVPADIAAALELEAGYPAWLVAVMGA